MAKEKNETYFVVHHWMISELGLKDTALLVYALIYGYTKTVGEFSGSVAYIMERINKSKPPVQDALKKLVEAGMLIKQDVYANGLKFVKYQAVEPGEIKPGGVGKNPAYQEGNLPGGRQKSCLGWEEILPGGRQKSCPNNKDKNKKENTLYIKGGVTEDEIEKNTLSGDTPDIQEIMEYIWQRQYYVDVEKFFDYYEARGWKRKNGRPIDDWRKLVDEWEERDKRTRASPAPVSAGGARPPKNAPTGESSFDVDDFFAAALRKSYGEDFDGG